MKPNDYLARLGVVSVRTKILIERGQNKKYKKYICMSMYTGTLPTWVGPVDGPYLF
jgi:hypothetical protein